MWLISAAAGFIYMYREQVVVVGYGAKLTLPYLVEHVAAPCRLIETWVSVCSQVANGVLTLCGVN